MLMPNRRKSMNFAKSLLIFAIILVVAPASAEYYKYIDSSGKVRYTDDLNQVPQDQRAGAQTFTEIKDQSEQTQPETQATDGDSEQNMPQTSELEQTKTRLDAEKKTLDETYKQLMEQRKQLEDVKASAKSPKEIKEYNEKVTELNEKIQEYENRRLQFNTDIDAYNSKVEVLNQKANQSE